MNTQNKTEQSQAEIQSCISMLEHLANHTIDLAQLPEEQQRPGTGLHGRSESLLSEKPLI